MIQKVAPPELITAAEAACIVKCGQTFDDLIRAQAIYEAFIAVMPCSLGENFERSSAIGAVYAAGRIQGIREERAKRRERGKK